MNPRIIGIRKINDGSFCIERDYTIKFPIKAVPLEDVIQMIEELKGKLKPQVIWDIYHELIGEFTLTQENMCLERMQELIEGVINKSFKQLLILKPLKEGG